MFSPSDIAKLRLNEHPTGCGRPLPRSRRAGFDEAFQEKLDAHLALILLGADRATLALSAKEMGNQFRCDR